MAKNNIFSELSVRSELEQTNDCIDKGTYSDHDEQRECLSDTFKNPKNYDSLDAVLDQVGRLEDLNELDKMLTKLYSDFQPKSESLKNYEENNNEMKVSIRSGKYFTDELRSLHDEEQKAGQNLRDMIEAKRIELEELLFQQVTDLEKFENDVTQMSKHFVNGPTEHESKNLLQKVLELKKDLEKRTIEFSQYKEDLQIAEGKLKQGPKLEKEPQDMSVKMFEESIEDINSLNEKLTKSVEQITDRVNTMRVEMKNFSLI